MRLTKIALFVSVILLSSCASDYGNITPMGGNRYQIVSMGDTRAEATALALKGAEVRCKDDNTRFRVINKTERYVGMFANERVHMQNKAMRDAFVNGANSMGMMSMKSRKVADVAEDSSDSYFENAFETTIDFTCM